MTTPAPIPTSKPLLLDALGLDFLIHVLASNEDEIRLWIAGDIELDTNQKVEASRELWQLLQKFSSVEDGKESSLRSFQIASLLSRYIPEYDRSVAGAVRSIAVGDDRPTETGDPLKDAISHIVADYYPVLLLPKPSGIQAAVLSRPNTWGHPASEKFEGVIRNDPEIMKLYTYDEATSEYGGNVIRSTGGGGGVQPSSLLDGLLLESWNLERASTRSVPTPSSLSSRVLEQLSTVRDAAAGRPAKTVARVGLTGVLLPTDELVDFGVVKLRPMIQSDLESVPQMIRTELRHQDADGNELTMSYAGDVLLEMEVDYKVKRVGAGDFMKPELFDNFPNEHTKVDAAIENLRLALLFLEPATPQVVMAAWRTIEDPLAPASQMGFDDLRRRPFVPTKLSSEQIDTWKANFSAIASHRTKKIDVAVRRTVRASSEREDREDVLVDAVIACENLVGSRQGETTLRVSGALAWLLEPSSTVQVRDERRKEIARLYKLRSDIVHGNRPLTADELAEQPNKALEVAVRALRILILERPELLRGHDSSERSSRLLLGG